MHRGKKDKVPPPPARRADLRKLAREPVSDDRPWARQRALVQTSGLTGFRNFLRDGASMRESL